jgi:integrase/recombinase XerD
MLANHYKFPGSANLFNSGPAAPYVEGFVHSLETKGYSDRTIRYHAGAVNHLCSWAASKSFDCSNLDDASFKSFLGHLPSCHCTLDCRGIFMHHAQFSIALFRSYLCKIGVLSFDEYKDANPEPVLAAFRYWMLNHRGVKESTLEIYNRFIPPLLKMVDGEANRINANTLRSFFIQRTKKFSAGYASNVANTLRVFVRYLVSEAIAPSGLDNAIPVVASWRDASLPRYLPSSDIDRVIEACDPSTKTGLRDRAIILLLVRLGLRASDVLLLQIDDLNWNDASIRVCGKGRREAQLPLTQEVGDAVIAYIQSGRPSIEARDLFIRLKPPIQPFADSSAISAIATAAIRRAGMKTPCRGAHVLRHSAATGMLRHGISLQQIGAVLRHRSLHTTIHYAKVDCALLRLVAQPWPEVTCAQ